MNSEMPLKNKVIVLTRSPEQISESSLMFNTLGARVILFPTIKITPPKSWKEFDELISKFSNHDYLVFTSVNTVKMFSRRCKELGIETSYTSTKVITIGRKTSAACTENNIPVHITPSQFTSKGIIKKLSEKAINGKRFFIPKSAIGRNDLQLDLEKIGAVVDTADVYDVVITDKDDVKEKIEELSKQKPDAFIFTSPSTFENFLKIMDLNHPAEYFHGLVVAAIGPTTKLAMEKRNVVADVMPKEHTVDGLATELVEFFKTKI
jgi:uroporphyrinogen-III synthase